MIPLASEVPPLPTHHSILGEVVSRNNPFAKLQREIAALNRAEKEVRAELATLRTSTWKIPTFEVVYEKCRHGLWEEYCASCQELIKSRVQRPAQFVVRGNWTAFLHPSESKEVVAGKHFDRGYKPSPHDVHLNPIEQTKFVTAAELQQMHEDERKKWEHNRRLNITDGLQRGASEPSEYEKKLRADADKYREKDLLLQTLQAKYCTRRTVFNTTPAKRSAMGRLFASIQLTMTHADVMRDVPALAEVEELYGGEMEDQLRKAIYKMGYNEAVRYLCAYRRRLTEMKMVATNHANAPYKVRSLLEILTA